MTEDTTTEVITTQDTTTEVLPKETTTAEDTTANTLYNHQNLQHN